MAKTNIPFELKTTVIDCVRSTSILLYFFVANFKSKYQRMYDNPS